MQLQSTDIRVKSSDGDNRSTTGADESIKHEGDQEEHFTRSSVGGPPSMSVGKGVQEFALEPKVSGIEGGNGIAKLKCNDAACQVETKDTNWNKCGAGR